jgi:hypothetical protein
VTGRVARLTALAAILGMAALFAPNAFWLFRSTVRIENRGAETAPAVVYTACATPVALGPLPAGASRFRVLPQCGDDSLVVVSAAGEVCRIYVEGELYHVRVWFASPGSGGCEYTTPPFSPLLVRELL